MEQQGLLILVAAVFAVTDLASMLIEYAPGKARRAKHLLQRHAGRQWLLALKSARRHCAGAGNAAISGNWLKKSTVSHSRWKAASRSSDHPPAWSACQVALCAMAAQANRTRCDISSGSGSQAVTRRDIASRFVHAASLWPWCNSNAVRVASVCARLFSAARCESDMLWP